MDLRPGAWLGPWLLREQIGKGGFGQVYLAADQSGKRAAVKILMEASGGGVDTETYRRFEQELALLQKLSGRATARVINANIEDTPPWIATQYVAGESLQAEISNDGPLDGELWWALTADMILGLKEAHKHKIIHRDIKPPNVMRSSRGSVIIDFGASLLFGSQEERITRQSTPLTVQYASPEQLQGHPVSGYTDVFSMGLTLGFAALGRPVFRAENLGEMVNRIVNDEPDLDQLDKPRREFLASLLRKSPGDRPTIRQAAELSVKLQKGRPPKKGNPPVGLPDQKEANQAEGRHGNVRRFRPSDREKPGDHLVSQNRISIKPAISQGPTASARSWQDIQIEVLNTLIRAGRSSFELNLGNDSSWLIFRGAFDQLGNLPLEIELNGAFAERDNRETRLRLSELNWEAPDDEWQFWLNMIAASEATKPKIARLIVATARASLEIKAEGVHLF